MAPCTAVAFAETVTPKMLEWDASLILPKDAWVLETESWTTAYPGALVQQYLNQSATVQSRVLDSFLFSSEEQTISTEAQAYRSTDCQLAHQLC